MSQPQPTELQKAAENINPSELADNLDKQTNNTDPQPLDNNEKTPFIDESLRTDK